MTKQLIRAEIERRIRANQTKNGFPAGSICAIRIEAYEELLSFIDGLEVEGIKRDKTAYINHKVETR